MIAVSLALTFCAGCGHARGTPVRCNPLGGGQGEDCLLPFPSAFYAVQDAATATGQRIDLSSAELPTSRFGARLDSTPYSHRDGFSAAAPLLAYFPARIDGSPLPAVEHVQRSLQPDSPVQLLRFDTGERVPLFAELDANASTPDSPGSPKSPKSDVRQALLIHPITRLSPATRYIAVIQGLRTTDGSALSPLTGFRALRDRTMPPDSSLTRHYENLFARLAHFGIKRQTLQLAWDFTTGSDSALTGRLVRMRDTAFEWIGAPAHLRHAIRIDRIQEHPANAPDVWLRLSGSFELPSFLEGGNGNRLDLDAAGEPRATTTARFPLTIHIPECAKTATAPLPVLIYGHGTFNSAAKEMSTDFSTTLLNKLCMIEIGTDWLGRAGSDLLYFLFKIIPNWNNFIQITDRLQQAHINVAALARLVRLGALDAIPELSRNGRSLSDPSKLYYLGISEGGCQGVTALALSPDIKRGALNVPCGFWSKFFWRSSDFYYTRKLLKLSYGDPLDQQKLLALSQLQWDYTDPATYGSHLLRDPLPGNATKQILYQEGINDASVPNLTTRAMARTIGLKLLGPGVESVHGIELAQGPQPSAYVQFNVGAHPRLGLTNVPPPVSEVHEQIRRLQPVQEQLRRFLREDGMVEDTCGGPCFFP